MTAVCVYNLTSIHPYSYYLNRLRVKGRLELLPAVFGTLWGITWTDFQSNTGLTQREHHSCPHSDLWAPKNRQLTYTYCGKKPRQSCKSTQKIHNQLSESTYGRSKTTLPTLRLRTKVSSYLVGWSTPSVHFIDNGKWVCVKAPLTELFVHWWALELMHIYEQSMYTLGRQRTIWAFILWFQLLWIIFLLILLIHAVGSS